MLFHCWVSSLSVRSVTEVISGSLTFIIKQSLLLSWPMASRHAFALRQFFFPLYIPRYRESLAFCHFLCHLWYRFFSQSSYLNEDHKWFTEFYTIDSNWTLRRILKTGSPCVHSSWHNTECHNPASVPFWLMRINLLSHVLLYDPLSKSSPFGSPYVLFPSGLELSGSVLHLVVL